MTEIDPCAFCGEYDGECAVSGVPNHQGKRKFAVYCNGCFSEGPPAETKEEAIEAWNHRATPAPAQPEVHAALRAAGLMLVRTEQGLRVERSLEATAEWAEKIRFNDGPTPNDPPFLFGDESAGAAAPAEGRKRRKAFISAAAMLQDLMPTEMLRAALGPISMREAACCRKLIGVAIGRFLEVSAPKEKP